MELIQLAEKTYMLKNPTNIGIYKMDEENVILIDSGNDKDAGKKILKIITEQGWKVKGIVNTHSNADHIGENKIIQERTGCKIYAHKIEKCFTEYPILESSFLYGAYPFKALQNKFLLAKETKVEEVENNLPNGLEYIELPGHFFSMIGIKTSDNIYFLGDAIFSEETIKKYHLFFIYNVKEYVDTLDYLGTLKGDLFIPSHVEATKDLQPLIEKNQQKIEEIKKNILKICEKEITFENILKNIFELYHLQINENQYVLIGSTIKSFLSYLCDKEEISYRFKNNQMLWKKI